MGIKMTHVCEMLISTGELFPTKCWCITNISKVENPVVLENKQRLKSLTMFTKSIGQK